MSIRKPWGLGCFEKRVGRWFEVLHQFSVFFYPFHCLPALLVTVVLMNLFSLTAHNPQEESFLRLHPFMVFYPAAVSQTGDESAAGREKTKTKKKGVALCESEGPSGRAIHRTALGRTFSRGRAETPAQPAAPSIRCISCSQMAYSLLDKIISFA